MLKSPVIFFVAIIQKCLHFNIKSGEGLVNTVQGIRSLPNWPTLTVGMNTSEEASKECEDVLDERKCSKDGITCCG